MLDALKDLERKQSIDWPNAMAYSGNGKKIIAMIKQKCINYMQGGYIELLCDYYTMHAHLHDVLPCVLVHALLSMQERGIIWASVCLTYDKSMYIIICTYVRAPETGVDLETICQS